MNNAPLSSSHERLYVLDGWRAISILLVLAAHMLPLGPKRFEFNNSTGLIGMSIFFTLSGFLITANLQRNPSTRSFFIRRFCRILPLAYLYILVALPLGGMFLARAGTTFPLTDHVMVRSWPQVFPHLLFLINYSMPIPELTQHFWSLCVEMHFYVLIGLLMCVTRFRGWLIIPLAYVGLTALKCYWGVPISIETHLRVDEILSGSCLALTASGKLPGVLRTIIAKVPFACWIGLLLLSAVVKGGAAFGPIDRLTLHAEGGLIFLRSVGAAGMVGHTLFVPDGPFRWMGNRVPRYIATVSYAVYVVHPLTKFGWLSSGSKIVMYAKRPICFALIFLLAHLSTFYYEAWWIERGRQWSKRYDRKSPRAKADPPLDRLQNAPSTV